MTAKRNYINKDVDMLLGTVSVCNDSKHSCTELLQVCSGIFRREK